MKTFNERSKLVIAQNALTYSKRSDQFIEGVYPTHVEIKEDKLIGEDGKEYIDFMGGLGATNTNLENISSIPLKIEVEVAELLQSKIPILERMKFLKTGSEACLAAVRIARAYNQKKVLNIGYGVGYHGWGDEFISEEDPGAGCVNNKYTKFDSLEDLVEGLRHYNANLVSYVIIEPVMLDMNVRPLLQEIRDLCTKLDIVLIFDEIITGFRVPEYCIANYFNIKPDLLCLGKTIANGYPISVVGGREELMNNPDYFVSSTFAGECKALFEMVVTIMYNSKLNLNTLFVKAKLFQDTFNSIHPDVQLKGYGTRAIWEGKYVNVFHQEMCKKGYICGRAFFLNHYNIEYAADFLEAARDVLLYIDGVKLEGNEPQPIFKRN